MEPVWVLDSVVLAVHKKQIAEHGGDEALRDVGLLDSALNRPKNLYAYGDQKPSLYQLAASLTYGIIKNHPFIDGNKRTAFVICNLFLELNNILLKTSMQDKYLNTIRLAEGSLSEKDFALWLEQNSVSLQVEA